MQDNRGVSYLGLFRKIDKIIKHKKSLSEDIDEQKIELVKKFLSSFTK